MHIFDGTVWVVDFGGGGVVVNVVVAVATVLVTGVVAETG